MDFGGLAARVSRGDALAEGVEAAHPGLYAAAGVVSRPPFPERPAVVTCGAQGFVACSGGWAILLPRSAILSDRNNRRAAARDDGAVAAAGVVGAVRGNGAGVFVVRDLAQQVRQDGAIAFPARGELDRADVGGGRIHRQMHLAPLASSLHTMIPGLPLAIAEELDAGAVHQQVQRPASTAIGDLHLQGLLPAAQGRVVRNGPVQPGQAQQAGDHSCGLPERQLEQHLDRQAELDRRVRKDGRTPWAPLMRRMPSHLFVQPDQQRSTHAERSVVVEPVRSAVADGSGFTHADRLTAWIRDVNPLLPKFCINAESVATG